MRVVTRISVVISTLALLLPLGGVRAPAASSGIGIAPARGDLSTVPGRIVEEILTVVNLSSDDYSISARLNDLTVDTNGTFSSAPTGSGLPSAVAWGVVQPSTFLLPSQHTQTVRIAFKPPAAAQPRGYYAIVNFEGSTTQGSAVRSMHPVLLDVDGPGVLRTGKIAAISASSVAFGSTARVTLHLENTGNVYSIAGGRVTIRDALSRVTAVVTIPNTPVLPGVIRIIQIDVPTPLIPGALRVAAELGFGPGVPSDSASTTLIAFAWWHVLVLAVLLLILLRLAIGVVGRRRRRRLTRKIKKDEGRSAKTPIALPVEMTSDLQSSWEPARAPAARPTPARPTPVTAVITPPPSRVEPKSVEPEPPAVELEPHSVEPEPPAVEHEPESLPAESEPEPRTPPVIVPIASRLGATQRPPAVEEVDRPEIELWPTPRIIPRSPAEPEPAAPKTAREVSVPEREPAASQPPVPPPPIPDPADVAAETPKLFEVERRDEQQARARQLLALVKAGIAEGPPAGREAASRRVKVAIDLLRSGSGRSAERLDVAMQIIASAGDVDAGGALGQAFEDAASSKRAGAMGSFALALARLESPAAQGALLRAYAVSPRAGSAVLRDALKNCDPGQLKAQPELLAALPEDRRAALKLR